MIDRYSILDCKQETQITNGHFSGNDDETDCEIDFVLRSMEYFKIKDLIFHY